MSRHCLYECANCGDSVDERSPEACFNNPTTDTLCESCLEDLEKLYDLNRKEHEED